MENIVRHAHSITKEFRAQRNGYRPCLLWFTGLSAAGKSTIADLVEQRLAAMQCHTYLLDGDNIRLGLCRDLGFTHHDRTENIRRIGEVGKLMVDAGLIVLTAFISPYRVDRDLVRQSFDHAEFFEIFVDAPLEECERRDPKGMYKKARAGQLENFTGISSGYEAPLHPELHLQSSMHSAAECADQVIAYLMTHLKMQS